MSDLKDSTSPFSMLLPETGSETPPSPPNAGRSQAVLAPQRSDAPRNAQRTGAERPQRTDEDAAADAPEACAGEQPDDNAVAAFEVAVAGHALPPPEKSPLREDTADEEIAAIDAAPVMVAEVPATTAPEQPTAIDAPAVAMSPATAAPTDPDAVESTPAAGVAAASPAGLSPAAAAPDTTVGKAEPTQAQAPQASETPQVAPAPQASEQTAPAATPSTPDAKPPVKQAATVGTSTAHSATSQPSSTTSDAAAPATSAGTQDQSEGKSGPKQPAHADTPPQHAARPHGPDASERPQNASAVSDFVQAAHQQTPDGSQFAQMHAGRDFGHAVAATAHAAQGADAARPLMSAEVPLASLAVEIAARAQGGSNRFEIRLDPPELGRIDVRLDIDRSGNVTSRLVVEKAETLDVLRRDAHQLERALQDAGLKTSDNGLQFSLRDQAFAERHDRGGDGHRTLIADPEAPAASGAPMAYGLTLRGSGGIDIRV